MIRAQQIVDLLKADGAYAAMMKAIDRAQHMPSAIDQLMGTPASYVGEGVGEKAQPSDTGSVSLRQKVTVSFTVLLVYQQIGATGTQQDDARIASRERLKVLLLGWTPNSEIDNPMQYAGTNTLDIDTAQDVLVDAVNFTSSYTIRSVTE